MIFNSSGLKYVDIPSNVEDIENNALRNCRNLESIAFDEDSKLKKIDILSFHYEGLKFINFTSSVEEIFGEAFLLCENIIPVTFPKDSKLKMRKFLQVLNKFISSHSVTVRA